MADVKTIKVVLDGSQATKGAKDVENSLKNVEGQTKKVGAGFNGISQAAKLAAGSVALLATGVTAAAGGIALWAKSQAQTGNDIVKMSQLAGTSTDTFQKWAYAARFAGVEQDKLSDIFKDTQDKVSALLQDGGGPLKDILDAWGEKAGLTADSFKNLSGPEALQLLVSGLEKAGVSQQDFIHNLESMGSDASLLLPILKNNAAALQGYSKEAEKLGIVRTDAQLAAAKELNDNWIRLQATLEGVSVKLGNTVLPFLSEFVKALTESLNKTGGLKEEADKLATDTSLPSWIEAVAIGMAALADATIGTVKAVALAAASFYSAYMDVKVLLASSALDKSGITNFFDPEAAKKQTAEYEAVMKARNEAVARSDKLAKDFVGGNFTPVTDATQKALDRVKNGKVNTDTGTSNYPKAPAGLSPSQLKANAEAAKKHAQELEKLNGQYKSLLGAVDPAAKKEREFADNMKLLSDLTKLSDADLQKLGITRTELANITQKTIEAHKRETGVIQQNIESVNRQIALMGVSKSAREAEAAAVDLSTKMKLQGLTVDEAQLATYKQRVQLLQQLQRDEDFNDNQKERIQGLRDEMVLDGLYGKQKEREAARLQVQREAEKAQITDVAGAVSSYMAAYDALQERIKQNNTAINGAQEAIIDYMERAEDVASATKDAMSSVLDSLEDRLAEFFRTGKFGFSDFVSVINSELSKVAARQTIGLFGSILGSIFGGFRADGGPVAGGSAYIVGERGPELFMPSSSGSIVPNHMLSGSVNNSTQTTIAPQIHLGGISVQGGNLTTNQVQALGDYITNQTMSRVVDELRYNGILR